MRICSLLPSATETLFALGLGDSIAGVTHECDFPAEAAKKPALIRPRVDPNRSPAEIDRQVSEVVARGESIYSVDANLLRSILPDLIVTQDLCHVCAASPGDLATALTGLPKTPRVLSLAPHSLADVWDDIRRIGEASGRIREAQALAITLDQRVAAIEMKTKNAPRLRVLCLEWLDPFYVAGHWVPEMVAKAGGYDVLGRAGEPSFRVSPEEIADARPGVVLIMPCGYNLDRAAREATASDIAARLRGYAPTLQRIFAVDANSYFSRPGPRIADGVGILAEILHPGLFAPRAAGRFREV
jgi:iron complex transport system substrate-binding protein